MTDSAQKDEDALTLKKYAKEDEKKFRSSVVDRLDGTKLTASC